MKHIKDFESFLSEGFFTDNPVEETPTTQFYSENTVERVIDSFRYENILMAGMLGEIRLEQYKNPEYGMKYMIVDEFPIGGQQRNQSKIKIHASNDDLQSIKRDMGSIRKKYKKFIAE
jgi:hypothetical protein